MPEKKRESEFVVTDRRRFSSEGETVHEDPQAEAQEPATPQAAANPAPAEPVAAPAAAAAQDGAARPAGEKPVPPPPSPADQKAGEDAYRESSKQLDAALRNEIGEQRLADLEMSFERFVASLYMSALMQMGLMREQGGQPHVDLIGARQTIDTLGILQQKTKGNLTMNEDHLLSNCLYELRMAYLDVTNALTRPPEPGKGPGPIPR